MKKCPLNSKHVVKIVQYGMGKDHIFHYCEDCKEDITVLANKEYSTTCNQKSGIDSSDEYRTALLSCEYLLQQKIQSPDTWQSYLGDEDIKDAISIISKTIYIGNNEFSDFCLNGYPIQQIQKELTAIELLHKDLMHEVLIRGAVKNKLKDSS